MFAKRLLEDVATALKNGQKLDREVAVPRRTVVAAGKADDVSELLKIDELNPWTRMRVHWWRCEVNTVKTKTQKSKHATVQRLKNWRCGGPVLASERESDSMLVINWMRRVWDFLDPRCKKAVHHAHNAVDELEIWWP